MSDNKISLVNLPEMPPSVDQAVGNLTNKPTETIGTTLADLLYIVFGGISHAAEKRKIRYFSELEDYKTELNSKIDSIPPERRVEPDFRIVGPALESVKFAAGDKFVREIFTNLIASSMDSQTSSITHPSFIEIVKQLDSFDALVLKHLHSNGFSIASICFRRYNITDQYPKDEDLFFKGLGTGEGNDIVPHYAIFDNAVPITNWEQIPTSFENLIRLGLITVTYTQSYANNSHYDSFLTDPFSLEVKNLRDEKYEIKAKQGICEVTLLGKNFIKVCL